MMRLGQLACENPPAAGFGGVFPLFEPIKSEFS